jgi:protein-S-isoprenylcysteine O-methyltransferase Ste14
MLAGQDARPTPPKTAGRNPDTAICGPLTFRSGVGILITALMLVPLRARIRSEERLLAEHFGSEYDSYR